MRLPARRGAHSSSAPERRSRALSRHSSKTSTSTSAPGRRPEWACHADAARSHSSERSGSGGVPAFRLTMSASTRPIASPEHWWCSSPRPSVASRASRRRPEDRARTRRTAARRHAVRAARAARRPRARARDVAAFARRGRAARSRALALPRRLARPADRRLALGRRLRRRGIDCAANRRTALLELSGYVPAPVLAEPGRRPHQHRHQMGRAGRPPPGELPDAPPRRPHSTLACPISLEEGKRCSGPQEGAAARRAGARRSPIATCASAAVLVGLPLDALRATGTASRGTPGATNRQRLPRRHGRFRQLRSRARPGRRCARRPVSMWPARRRNSRRARKPAPPSRPGAIIGLATARSLGVECEYRAEAGAPGPLRHLVVSAPRRRLIPRPQLPNARVARAPEDRYPPRTLEGRSRHRAQCAAFRAETSSFVVMSPIWVSYGDKGSIIRGNPHNHIDE
jgi:hypothetical protein